MMNLQLLFLFLFPALSMIAAKPIPIEFNSEPNPTSYLGPFPNNLDLIQEVPTLENSDTAYSGITVANSFGMT